MHFNRIWRLCGCDEVHYIADCPLFKDIGGFKYDIALMLNIPKHPVPEGIIYLILKSREFFPPNFTFPFNNANPARQSSFNILNDSKRQFLRYSPCKDGVCCVFFRVLFLETIPKKPVLFMRIWFNSCIANAQLARN